MTTHPHSLAPSSQEYRLPVLVRLYRNWRARARVPKLAAYNEFILRDLGLTPGNIFWSLEMPLSRNAKEALKQWGTQPGTR